MTDFKPTLPTLSSTIEPGTGVGSLHHSTLFGPKDFWDTSSHWSSWDLTDGNQKIHILFMWENKFGDNNFGDNESLFGLRLTNFTLGHLFTFATGNCPLSSKLYRLPFSCLPFTPLPFHSLKGKLIKRKKSYSTLHSRRWILPLPAISSNIHLLSIILYLRKYRSFHPSSETMDTPWDMT